MPSEVWICSNWNSHTLLVEYGGTILGNCPFLIKINSCLSSDQVITVLAMLWSSECVCPPKYVCKSVYSSFIHKSKLPTTK
jgi:hypothetical protein